MTLLYYDPALQDHKTGNHPESGSRLATVYRHLHFVGVDSFCRRPSWQAATAEQLGYVHDANYIKALRSMCFHGGGTIDGDTHVVERSFATASLAAGAARDAALRVGSGEDQNAFCLIRPPGHHATASHAMGFCLFNNVALAARAAQRELGMERILIVDFDVHHGNGTQDIFYRDPHVGFVSMHRWPFYPHSGEAEAIGQAEGLGTNCNVPIEMGVSAKRQADLLRAAVEQMAERIRPELILVSAGFDSHRLDPVGSLGLETEDFEIFTEIVLNAAKAHCKGRLVSLLEGGYNPEVLADCVELHLETLCDAAPK